MAKNPPPVKTTDQRLTSIEQELTQINKKLGILTAPFERGTPKPDRVIYDGVKTMSFAEAERIPGHWEVRGKEWVRIADK